MKFNLNYKVRVKLTERGRVVHRKNHESLFANWKELPPYSPPREDADGWSEWQLWDLMREFGPHLYNGCQVPFETEIEVPEVVPS